MTYKEILGSLVSIPSVSGFEKLAYDGILKLFGEDFDKVEADGVGNVLLYRRSAKEGAPLLMLDAHMDEIGFAVSEFADGFLEVVPSGGLDPTIFEGMEVTVHGKMPIPGVLSTKGEKKERKNYVFTGVDGASLEESVKIGDAVTFRCELTEMANERLAGHAFDDKACGAALICAVLDVPQEELAFDVAVCLSSREEVGGGGAGVAAQRLSPCAVLVTDVNFATAPGIPAEVSGKLGSGAMLSLSAVTDRQMTEMIVRIAADGDIPLTATVESTSTGTNANHIYTEGIPCAVLSLPLAGMHSYSECLSMKDVESFTDTVKALITSAYAADEMGGWNRDEQL